ncbi:hypothetical protein NOJ05_13650 [Neorhizobium galegae]|uniref:hypothetical protein n=1 Tax=Neorhizobium galegae TaxID=399 RepID=UPI002106A585|nr:hypothetical protein [Neorhizobium galegae]MCQ1778247.1 hypothetical protein [Neorhizobium galegae]MCQ1796779.1 hypothetical protein [Neorhizobium galegae]
MSAALFTREELLECEGIGFAPILMKPDEIICLKEAAHRARRTEKTTSGMCKEFRIYRQTMPCAPLEISAPALEMVLHGDVEALELFRLGKRHHPRVKIYFEHLGLPC